MAVVQPTGMSRPRHNSQLDEYSQPITSNNNISGYQQPAPQKVVSQSTMNRRISTSSNASGRGFFGFGRSKSKVNVDADFGDDWENAGGDADHVPDLSIGALSELRDRDRYPTMGGAPVNKHDSGRTMSISSTTSFDTTPMIPVFSKNPLSKESGQNAQYRKNLTNSRKQALRTSEGVPFPPPMHPGGPYRQSVQNGPSPGPGPYRRGPPSQYGLVADPGLRSMTGPSPEYYNYPNSPNFGQAPMGQAPVPGQVLAPGPGPYYGNRTMSMSSTGYPDHDPNNQHLRGPSRASSRPISRLSQNTNLGESRSGSTNESNNTSPARNKGPMVDSGTMIQLPAVESSGMQTDDTTLDWSDDRQQQPIIKEIPVVSNTSQIDNSSIVTPEAQSTIDELRKMNDTLLKEVRLVTAELGDSLRRELGVPPEDELNDDTNDDNSESQTENSKPVELAKKLVHLEQELDMERHKRLIAESHVPALDYSATEYEANVWEMERRYKNEQRENKQHQERIEELSTEYDKLEIETNNLKDGILPELRSHLKDLEVLTAAGNPIELLKQIDELKVENKKMQDLVEENSTRGPLGEKLKAVESQRDALREALRSQRERKDHEIRQATERIRQLESRLEKERVILNQMQRKRVQLRTASGSYMSPTITNGNGFSPVLNTQFSTTDHNVLQDSIGSSSYSSTDSSPGEQPQGLSKRRGVGPIPGIVPPAPFTEFGISSVGAAGTGSGGGGGRPASPVSFEISQEPAWLDYVDPSRIGSNSSSGSSGGGSSKQMSTEYDKRKSSTNGAISPSSGIYGLNLNLSSSSLSLPNGRSEQLPLSLGDMAK